MKSLSAQQIQLAGLDETIANDQWRTYRASWSVHLARVNLLKLRLPYFSLPSHSPKHEASFPAPSVSWRRLCGLDDQR
jgi:hypothetical protein